MALQPRSIKFRPDQEQALLKRAKEERHGNVSAIVKRAVDRILGLQKRKVN